LERAVRAGVRSLFVGFESLSPRGLAQSQKRQNLGRDYREVIRRLDDNGVMINGSFVFGFDGDDPDVFARTVDWAIENSITTATFHILTPYPGTELFTQMDAAGRIVSRDWDRYDTRTVIFEPRGMSAGELKEGYDWAYRQFYRWSSIARASRAHKSVKHRLKHFFYSAGWKKFEPAWDLVIRLQRLADMRPLLEAILAPVRTADDESDEAVVPSHLSIRDSFPD
jgi:radical SAM superfamily enzyme YgiQ (UPF0313 family)